jgi:hypothetical protein
LMIIRWLRQTFTGVKLTVAWASECMRQINGLHL